MKNNINEAPSNQVTSLKTGKPVDVHSESNPTTNIHNIRRMGSRNPLRKLALATFGYGNSDNPSSIGNSIKREIANRDPQAKARGKVARQMPRVTTLKEYYKEMLNNLLKD